MRAHVIENGIIVNTIIVGSLDDLPGLITAEGGGSIGDTYNTNTGAFTAPPPPPIPVPESVLMAQARLALLGAGKLALVQTVINSLPSPQKEEAQIEWEYRPTVVRSSALVVNLAPALGLDDAALDQLFILAATL